MWCLFWKIFAVVLLTAVAGEWNILNHIFPFTFSKQIRLKKTKTYFEFYHIHNYYKYFPDYTAKIKKYKPRLKILHNFTQYIYSFIYLGEKILLRKKIFNFWTLTKPNWSYNALWSYWHPVAKFCLNPFGIWNHFLLQLHNLTLKKKPSKNSTLTLKNK